MRYFLDKDHDGNWYLIPVRCRDEWLNYLNRLDFRLIPCPLCAKQLQTCYRNVTFTDPLEQVPL